MKRLAAALAWTLLASLPALAQSAFTVVEAPESLSCLQPGSATRGTPEFPEALLAARQRATVNVELTFDAPDAAPSMSVTDISGSHEFVRPLREFVSRYRMPCLPAGQRSTLRQEFVFDPTDGRRVKWLDPTSEDEARAARSRKCMAHASGIKAPEYPFAALRNEVSGKVVVKLRFEAADKPPLADVVGGAGRNALDAAVLRFAEGLRMPCLEGTAVTVTQTYAFRFEGDRHAALNDVSLLGFLRSVKDIDKAVVYFDFGRMACPFDLRLSLMQPFSPNVVGEVGESHPERRHFLQWLRRLELNLPKRTLNQVVSETMTVSVPCGVLNLGPTTGGGASQ